MFLPDPTGSICEGVTRIVCKDVLSTVRSLFTCYILIYVQQDATFFSVALRPNAGHGLLILEVFLDHTTRGATVGRTPLYK
jgi:hypothetical protein